MRALGNLGRLLAQAGRNVISGLISGIQSMLGPLGSVMGGIAGKIRGFLPFSPARVGPLSGRGNPELSGQSIAAMLARGLTTGTAHIDAAMNRLTAPLATPAFTGAGATPAAPAAAPAAGAVYNISVTPQQVALDEAGLLHTMRVAELRARVGRPR